MSRAQTAADEEVAHPTDQAERKEGPQRSGVVAQQEMELLEMPSFPRELAAERQGGESDREAEQPPLPAEEAPRAAKGPELELRGEVGGHGLGEALRPLQPDALGQLRVLFQIFFDQRARGWAGLARQVERQQVQDDLSRDIHSLLPFV